MPEFFIKGSSFAAPVFGEELANFVIAGTPEEALHAFVARSLHPYGIYACDAFGNADDCFKGRAPLARWMSNHAIARARLTDHLGVFTYTGHGPGRFEISGVLHEIPEPRQGRIMLPGEPGFPHSIANPAEPSPAGRVPPSGHSPLGPDGGGERT